MFQASWLWLFRSDDIFTYTSKGIFSSGNSQLGSHWPSLMHNIVEVVSLDLFLFQAHDYYGPGYLLLVSKVNCNLGSLDSLGNLIALNTLGLSLFGSQMACHFDLWFKAKTTIKCFSCTVHHHVFCLGFFCWSVMTITDLQLRWFLQVYLTQTRALQNHVIQNYL